jgi:hypothetical protein
MFCLCVGPIHTFFLSNQECGIDKTNRLYLDQKYLFLLVIFAGYALCFSSDAPFCRAENQIARIYISLFVYLVSTDCLCLIDSCLFTFVYVNDGSIHNEPFNHRGYGSLWGQPASVVGIIGVGWIITYEEEKTTTKESP